VQPKSEDNRTDLQLGPGPFLDESRTLAFLPPSNIVRVMRYFKANSTAYMVMEFVDRQGAAGVGCGPTGR